MWVRKHLDVKGYDRHQWERLFWIAMVFPTVIWWKESVLWVALMSLYANWATADGAHQAHQARMAQDDEAPADSA